MDKIVDRWSAPRGVGVVMLVGALTLAFATAYLGAIRDPIGVILVGVGTVLIAYFGATVLLLRPRLSADATGVTYRGLFGRKHLPWDGLEIKRQTTRHWGRESILLELSRGDELLFLGRWELGEATTTVALELEQLRPR